MHPKKKCLSDTIAFYTDTCENAPDESVRTAQVFPSPVFFFFFFFLRHLGFAQSRGSWERSWSVLRKHEISTFCFRFCGEKKCKGMRAPCSSGVSLALVDPSLPLSPEKRENFSETVTNSAVHPDIPSSFITSAVVAFAEISSVSLWRGAVSQDPGAAW